MPFEFEKLFQHDTRPADEVAGLVRLMSLFAALPPPPDPFGLYPDYPQLKEKFLDSAKGKDPDQILEIDAQVIRNSIGGLPRDHMHCARLAAETLQGALHDYMMRHKKKNEEGRYGKNYV